MKHYWFDSFVEAEKFKVKAECYNSAVANVVIFNGCVYFFIHQPYCEITGKIYSIKQQGVFD